MILTFIFGEVRRVAADARTAETSRPHRGENTGPGLWLTAGEGVYLMSNRLRPRGENPEHVFARECDPAKVSQWRCEVVKWKTMGRAGDTEFVPIDLVDSFAPARPLFLTAEFTRTALTIGVTLYQRPRLVRAAEPQR